MQQNIYLPVCVSKKELRNYWGVSPATMYRRLLTDDLLREMGYSYEEIKSHRILGPDLTGKIYAHFGITNLNKMEIPEAKPG